MLAALPTWLDDEFVRGASVTAVAIAVTLGIATLIWVRSLATRFVVAALLAVAVLAGLRYRDQIEDCAKTCDCSIFGEDLTVDGCGVSATP